MLAKEWRMCVYCTILMTWLIYAGRIAGESFVTFMLTQKELGNAAASRASIFKTAGATLGSILAGYLSQFFGRRRAILFSAFLCLVPVPAWIIPTSEKALSATSFFVDFFLQGFFGVVPIHLNELSPVAFRSSFVGITFQVGTMLSAPATQIVNAIAENTSVTLPNGHKVEAYGPVIGIGVVISTMAVSITTLLGPERRGRSFEHAVAGISDMSGTQAVTTVGEIADEEKGVNVTTEVANGETR